MLSNKLSALSILFLSGLSALAQAQSISQSPSATSSPPASTGGGTSSCVSNCLSRAVSAAGCSSLTDISCICTSSTFKQVAFSCLQSSCSASDIAVAEALQQAQCGGTVPSTPTPSSIAQPSSAAAPPQTTGGGANTSLAASSAPQQSSGTAPANPSSVTPSNANPSSNLSPPPSQTGGSLTASPSLTTSPTGTGAKASSVLMSAAVSSGITSASRNVAPVFSTVTVPDVPSSTGGAANGGIGLKMMNGGVVNVMGLLVVFASFVMV